MRCTARWAGIPPIVVDIDPVKRAAAKKAGAVAVVDPNAPDAIEQIQELTNGGAWAVIDVVGASQTARLGYGSLAKGGKYIIVGLFGGDLTISLPPIPMRALTIQGSYVGSVPEMTELMDLVRRTGLPDVPVTTRRLDDVNAVHGRVARRQGGRPRGADACSLIKTRTRRFYLSIAGSRDSHAARNDVGNGDADGCQ